MDQIRRILATIQKHLGGMTSTQKLLLGSLGVIMLMTLFLISQYAAAPATTPVWPGAGAEDQKKAAVFLQAAGFTVTNDRNNQVTVPASQVTLAQARLGEAGHQPADTQLVFENILKNQSWMNSKETNRDLYNLSRDNWLTGVLAKFHGVSSAQVHVDAPEQIGLGSSTRLPTASVTLFSSSGAVPQATVDAAAKLVAGAVAGLDLDHVTVLDGTTGRACKVQADGDLAAATNREHARAIERDYEQKLSTVLADIDGVVVAVTATVDTTRVRTDIVKNLPSGEGTLNLPKHESTHSQTDAQAAGGAEPGVRSNVAANITGGGASGNKSEQKTEETDYTAAIGTEHRDIVDPRGMPTRLVATVAVPRSFIIGAIQRDAPAAAGGGGVGGGAPAAPSDADVQARFEKEKLRITQAVEPHLKTTGTDGAAVPGEVVVVMMSGSGGGAGGGGGGSMGGGGFTSSFGTMWAMGGGVLDKAVLGLLAVVALGMMAMMVRRAGKRVEMPTPEELVGLPPALETKTDLVGEADETETAMAGIEVGEEEIKASKMRESVSDFIKQNPESASKLLNRWVSVEH